MGIRVLALVAAALVAATAVWFLARGNTTTAVVAVPPRLMESADTAVVPVDLNQGSRKEAALEGAAVRQLEADPVGDASSFDERMEAKYGEYTREQLRAEIIHPFGQMRGEFLNAEVERYVASGMAERVPEEDAFISASPTPGVQPALHLEGSTGHYYKVLLTEEECPGYFAIDAEWRWLCKKVYGHEDIMIGKIMGGDK